MSKDQPRTVRQRAAVAIGAAVAQRRQELVQQVAVCGVQFDQLETEALGAHRAGSKGGDDLGDAGLVQFLRRRIGGMERQRRRRHRGPATRIVGRQLATAVPRSPHRGLAAGMAQLDAQRHRRPAADAGQHLRQRRLGAVIPQAQVGPADATARLDRGGFQDQQAGAGLRQVAQVHGVPVAGAAIFGGVLAHRRDHDAVGQGG
ncbi:hypothetical protein G6F23_013341 [Rhizopus arrhizus]|nr:hypothetical protein G6F23_013341 [Rhizopus arrhizus]